MRTKVVSVAVAAAVLAGCAQIPNGPSVAVMPPPGKPFDLFVQDDQLCRNYASQAIGGTSASQASAASLASSAVIGTALGAAVGAMAGGHNSVGTGAAIGATGGTVIGLGAADYAGRSVQQRYDIAYSQCMYSRGNVLPGQAVSHYNKYGAPPPPPPGQAPPPPPPGQPPPPPPVQ